jgi:hypothetical protein
MPVESKTIKLVILHESEIRKAALLMDQAYKLPKDVTEEQSKAAWMAAVRAAFVALHGAGDADALLMLANFQVEKK